MAKYNKPVFVNQLLSDRSVKTTSKFIAYRTWDAPSLWFAKAINNGNDFFHWYQRKANEGHKDIIINHIASDGQK